MCLETITRRTAATLAALEDAEDITLTPQQLTRLLHDLQESGARVLAACDHLTGITDPGEGVVIVAS
jgi:hypothetical protein